MTRFHCRVFAYLPTHTVERSPSTDPAVYGSCASSRVKDFHNVLYAADVRVNANVYVRSPRRIAIDALDTDTQECLQCKRIQDAETQRASRRRIGGKASMCNDFADRNHLPRMLTVRFKHCRSRLFVLVDRSRRSNTTPTFQIQFNLRLATKATKRQHAYSDLTSSYLPHFLLCFSPCHNHRPELKQCQPPNPKIVPLTSPTCANS